MEKRKKNHQAQAGLGVERMRRLYSSIGEPLPADVIIDLYRHLDTALELARQENSASRPAKRLCRRPN